MAGKVKKAIEQIITENAKGDSLLEEMTKTKIIMKGINPRLYDVHTEDDPEVLGKLQDLAHNLGVTITK
ncbi:hypothetical protein IMZ31_21385 (plasmid) [Pontibacillus sp. ALD_SL1]|uniref:hypothetical protein n=1 Tax=Pontibacillus sp. ALD_SL1 TaxID=2777185 RepID=UPI001A956FCE|nr:hypothetical protein [Pontibacillus sp. ALD_SL1]QST03105.1 hypothetical protein IMZ31_21385 [Pontibacillus sp. ALD_SL1]